jgi:hypothetical protein
LAGLLISNTLAIVDRDQLMALDAETGAYNGRVLYRIPLVRRSSPTLAP